MNDMKEFVVYYLIEEGKEKPFYVGKTTRGRIGIRLNEHKSRSRYGKTPRDHLISKILKSGNRVLLNVVASVKTEDECHSLEMALIKHHGRRNNKTGILCNLTDGGEGAVGTVCGEEARKKMSDAKKGNKINIGRVRPDVKERSGKMVSAFDANGKFIETFSSLHEADAALDVDYRAISTALNGRDGKAPHGHALSRNGERFQFRFGVFSENISSLVLERRKRKMNYLIAQKDENGNVVRTFRTMKEAMQETGFTGIAGCMTGRHKTSGGFFWTKEPL